MGNSHGIDPPNFKPKWEEIGYVIMASVLAQACMLLTFSFHRMRTGSDMARGQVGWWWYTIYELITKIFAFFSGWANLLACSGCCSFFFSPMLIIPAHSSFAWLSPAL